MTAGSPHPTTPPREELERLYIYWCPICKRQTERSWHYVGMAGLFPQTQEEHNCQRIEVVPIDVAAKQLMATRRG